MKKIRRAVLWLAALSLMSCAAWSSNPGPSGERAASAEVASTISEKLMEAEVKGWETIDIKVAGNSLILCGEAASKEEREKILAIAKENAGSLEVEDRLSVRGNP